MTPPKKAAAAPDDAGAVDPRIAELEAQVEQLSKDNDTATAKATANEEACNAAGAQFDRLAAFLKDSYPAEERSDEGPIDTAIRLLDRAGVPTHDAASGLPIRAPGMPADGPALRQVTLPPDLGHDATLEALAKDYDVDRGELLELNLATLDAEATARGLGHSDNGRILFPGTVLVLPEPKRKR